MRKRHKQINASAKAGGIIAMSAPVIIAASEGDKSGPRKFEATFYTGGALEVDGYDRPVVVDLSGLSKGNVLVANLDHVKTQRVGNFDVANDGKTLVASGTATAKTSARDEVIGSADEGYQWQASIEARPHKLEAVNAGKVVTVNGQTFKGPVYVARTSTLKGFAFVSHGADDNTTVTIAATAASTKGNDMDPKLQAWIEATLPGIDIETLGDEAIANLTAQYKGQQKPKTKAKVADVIAAAEEEDARREKIADITAQAIADNPGRDADFIARLKALAENAIEAKWTPDKFDVEVLRALRPQPHTVSGSRGSTGRLTNRVIEAAICAAGRLDGYESKFDDQTLQTAHDQFKNGIGLKQLFLLGAEANGYRGSYASDVTIEVQRAAFGMVAPNRQIEAAGFSTLVVPTIISNTANLFLREGWNAVDLTPLRISYIRPVRNFQTITTASLTGDLQYEKVGATGEIKHGTLGETTYTNKADTYAKMLSISRQDIINDDLSALTAVPRRLGRGAALKLNDIFWTEWLVLVSASFFASGNSNINTGVADMTIGGLDATETIFMNQTDPDGKPLGVMPKILVVPTALKNKAVTLMDSEKATYGTSYATAPGDGNPFRGRFNVESSPYISNASYTGATSQGWWMIANPNELPVIEIAALNGRVEPVVETADAEFNVLGVSMRGYSDVGVKRQEYRAGVYADGNSS